MINRRQLLLRAAGAGIMTVPAVQAAHAYSTIPPNATTATAATVRPLYDARPMLIGESLSQMLDYTQEAAALSNRLIANAVSPLVHSVEIIPGAAGGSVSCPENNPGVGSNYWVLYNFGAPSDGPLLTAVLAEIARRIATLDGRPPTAFLYELGFNEVAGMAGLVGGLTAAQALTQYVASVTYMFGRLQAALLPSWGPVPIYITPLGRALGGGGAYAAGYDAIRQAQLNTLLSIEHTVRVADIYDMGVESNVHPARNWRDAYGERQANAMLNTQYGASVLARGPTITGITQPAGNTVEVHIVAESGDTVMRTTHPSGPCGFAFYDGATPLSAKFLRWNGGNPQWVFSSSPSDLKLRFPSEAMPDFDPARLITGAASTLPLAGFYS